MKRTVLRLLTVFLAAALPVCLSAQGDVNAVIQQDHEVFKLLSPTSGKLSVTRVVLVNNEDGLEDAGTFLLYTDSFSSLASFKGEVKPLVSGKEAKIKKQDLVTQSLTTGLAEDGVAVAYQPHVIRYPVIIRYEYEVSYHKGIASFPLFLPVTDEKVSLEEASFSVDVPEGYPIKSFSKGMEQQMHSSGGRDTYSWHASHVPPYVWESMMPPILERVPFVFSSPRDIQYGGYKGSQEDWAHLGSWLAQMQEGTRILPKEAVAKVQSLTAECETPFEKLRVLYDYLRQTTRYVSIQLGIGGLRPMPASEVFKTGFGDCKGLSNYLAALLEVAGVPSDYYIINTDRKSLFPGYASVGQMNHAMLAVPLPDMGDTVWVECTNPQMPLGYRHEDAAGHEVVLIKPGEPGEKVRIPTYADSLSRRIQHSRIELRADGSAQIELERELYLDMVEPYLDFENLRPDVRNRMLTGSMKLQADRLTLLSVTDNFRDYPQWGRAFVPEMRLKYRIETQLYANGRGDRLFVPVNPVAHQIAYQKSERRNDVTVSACSTYEDFITLQLPQGYHLESLPEGYEQTCDWGHFHSRISQGPSGEIVIHQKLEIRPCRFPADRYSEFRDFARIVNKQYDGTLVLKKD